MDPNSFNQNTMDFNNNNNNNIPTLSTNSNHENNYFNNNVQQLPNENKQNNENNLSENVNTNQVIGSNDSNMNMLDENDNNNSTESNDNMGDNELENIHESIFQGTENQKPITTESIQTSNRVNLPSNINNTLQEQQNTIEIPASREEIVNVKVEPQRDIPENKTIVEDQSQSIISIGGVLGSHSKKRNLDQEIEEIKKQRRLLEEERNKITEQLNTIENEDTLLDDPPVKKKQKKMI